MTSKPSSPVAQPSSQGSPAGPSTGALPRRRLGELLVTARLISPEVRNQALDEARRQNMRLGQYLVLQKVIKEIHLVKAISYQLKVEMFNPQRHIPDTRLRELLPRELLVQRQLCPVTRQGEILYVAMLDPTDMQAVDDIVFATGLDVEPLICTKSQLAAVQEQLLGQALIHLDQPAESATPAPGPDVQTTPAMPSGELTLSLPIDMDAIQAPGAYASPQGLAAGQNGSLMDKAGRTPAAPHHAAGSTALPLDLDAYSVSMSGLLQEMAVNTGAALAPGESGQPELTLIDTLDAIPEVEALPVEVVDAAATAPSATAAEQTPDIRLQDAAIARRIQAVAGVSYEREEVIRAALMLGLAVLEEEPRLVTALNIQTRDPWR
ncbi:GspE/PulE/PilB domain-containing protein [Megalodesulfovibrio paquesii]